jgi:hypothetical protein
MDIQVLYAASAFGLGHHVQKSLETTATKEIILASPTYIEMAFQIAAFCGNTQVFQTFISSGLLDFS